MVVAAHCAEQSVSRIRATDEGSAVGIFGVNRRWGERRGHDTLQILVRPHFSDSISDHTDRFCRW
jgi:hypothetical protein